MEGRIQDLGAFQSASPKYAPSPKHAKSGVMETSYKEGKAEKPR
jgi:hypothetical protein